jgi:CDP-diacylglycerol--serine O-phosphatidyltransferase
MVARMVPREKRQGQRPRLFHGKGRRLKYITILPSLVTLLNGVFGFAAIVLAANHNFVLAAYFILLAMVADVFDGHLARISKSASSFGGQLDSLCDIISFGAAPAFLMFKIFEYKVELRQSELLERFVWLAAAAYMCCTAIRLARFNVENVKEDSSHTTFTGLPSPAAAGVIISLVIFHQQRLMKFFDEGSRSYQISENILIYSLPIIALLMAALMVSRVKYPHLINLYLKGKKPIGHLMWLLAALGIVWWNLQLALVFLFCGFTVGGPLKWLYLKAVHRQEGLIGLPAEQPTAIGAGSADNPSQDGSV